jgi:hypothetical protein
MSINIDKLIKNHYKSEIDEIYIPAPPFEIEKKENGILGFVLSFALTAGSILFIFTGINSEPSLLAEKVAVFSEYYEIDNVIDNSFKNIKKAYDEIFKEE